MNFKTEPGEGIPLLGDNFPEMEVQTTHGKMKLPSNFAGKWFILLRHPGDFTPMCTAESVGYEIEIAPRCRANLRQAFD